MRAQRVAQPCTGCSSTTGSSLSTSCRVDPGAGGSDAQTAGVTAAVSDCYHDVGVMGECETRGLSASSGHRPADFLSNIIGTPPEFDCGGTERHVVDTTVHYPSASGMDEASSGHHQKGVNAAEERKLTVLKSEVAAGKRTALKDGYRFVPVATSERGVLGKQMEKLLEWLADYGAKNRGVLSYLGEEAAEVKAKLIHRWTQRLSVAIHRSTMEAVWARAQLVITAHGEWKGKEALTGVELRFSGARGRQ